MEAMAMGIPVITTNWSGPTAFMNEDVGYPLSIDGLVEIVADGPHFFSYFVSGRRIRCSLGVSPHVPACRVLGSRAALAVLGVSRGGGGGRAALQCCCWGGARERAAGRAAQAAAG
jgi:hypothetical protein